MGRIGHKGTAAAGNAHQQLKDYQDKVHCGAQRGDPEAFPGIVVVCSYVIMCERHKINV
jgi:hypothetical protein